ncbi:MAG TPA: thermonuclease family protein [Nitrospira sp.]|nr:thermonuclease family protein [Nitrospira sp.]
MSAGGLHGMYDIPSGFHLCLFYRSPKEFLPFWNMRLYQPALYILIVFVSACGTHIIHQPTLNLDRESQFTNVTVHDCSEADTCTISLSDPTLPPIFGQNIPIRLKGIHAWAIKGRCPQETELAKKARDFLRAQLGKAMRIDVVEPERDKYFRLHGYLIMDGNNLSTALIAAGHAQPDSGGTKLHPPCPAHTPLNCKLQCR